MPTAHVQPNVDYHLKIVIADALDGYYDSDLFLEAGGFTTGTSAIDPVQNQFRLWPNPVNQVAFLNLPATTGQDCSKLILRNVQGVVQKEIQTCGKNFTLDCSALNPGL